MERGLSWTPIKTEDIQTLQDYSVFLRGISNAMEGVEYVHDLDLPANMLTIGSCLMNSETNGEL